MEYQFFSPFPKYLQIREILLRRIEREFDIGGRFPTEQALCEEFGVSRETVREALSGLERDGLISRRRGRGTYVTKHPEPKLDTRLTGLVEDFSALKFDTEARVLEKGPINPPRGVASALELDPAESIYRIMRLRMFEGRPLSAHESFLPLEHGVRVAKLDLRYTSMVYELEHTLNVPLWDDSQHIEAVIAETTMAALLDVPLGAPLLMLTRLCRTTDGRPAVLFRSHFRSDRYYYTVKLAQPGKPGARPRDRGTRGITGGI